MKRLALWPTPTLLTSPATRPRPQRGWLRLLWLGGLCMSALAQAQKPAAEGQPQQLQQLSLRAGFHNIQAQLALTGEQRQIGLMHRPSMPEHEGMLFVFEQPAQQCFWMKNTLIPLAIAFLGDDGSIVNLDEMPAQTTDSHCSTKPVRYVLEMNRGWFKKRGLKAGDKIQGGPFQSR